MTIDISAAVLSIMSGEPRSVHRDCIMTEVAEIFDTQDFHHLPVIDDDSNLVGIISKSDYLQLQHQFSALRYSEAGSKNKRFFQALTASDVMNIPVTISPDATIEFVIDSFLKNTYRSLLVVNKGKCIGIVTPYDILRLLKKT